MHEGWIGHGSGRWMVTAVVVLGALSPVALAGKAHDHGVARLDIAVEPNRITILFDTPLDNLLGFERAPRTVAERAAVDAMLARLKAAEVMMRVDGVAGCTSQPVSITAAALGVGGTQADKGGHAELEAQFEFRCQTGSKAAFIEVGLFEAFPRLARIELQVAGPRGQFMGTLKRPNGRVALVR